jgi:hypothetical protein
MRTIELKDFGIVENPLNDKGVILQWFTKSDVFVCMFCNETC